MRISNCNWQAIGQYLKADDRCVLPMGSTEQHSYLSLATDSILAERVSVAAAEPLGIPVFPVTAYGATPQFMAFPGTVTLQLDTLFRLVADILDSLVHHGFRRILIVNGHGGNNPVGNFIQDWKLSQWKLGNTSVQVQFHSWWNAPGTWAQVMEIDPCASHASWMENFPWTRLEGIVLPTGQKPMVDMRQLKASNPDQVARLLMDGNYGGYFQRSDEEMKQLWDVAVEETRDLLETGWI